LPEVNVHGVTGFLSELGDTDDMAKNAIYLLGNEERLQLFKQNALEHAKQFSLEAALPLYEEIYKNLSVNCLL
jgi:L-malate glycosyltransferase